MGPGGLELHLRERIAADPAVEVILGSEVKALDGDGHLERVTIEDTRTGERRTLEAQAIVVLIGAEPPTEWLAEELALDDHRFILTGPALGRGLSEREPWRALGREPFLVETSRPGVFAVGDVRAGSTKRVAAAVGEGAAAVAQIHTVLALQREQAAHSASG